MHKNVPFVISFIMHSIVLIIISLSFESYIKFPEQKNQFISVNLSLTADDIQSGNSQSQDKDRTKFHQDDILTETNQEGKDDDKTSQKQEQKQVSEVKTTQPTPTKLAPTLESIEKKPNRDKEIVQKKDSLNEKKDIKDQQNKKKFRGLGGFLHGINSKNAANVTGVDATSIQQQIVALWAISVFDQKSIKGMVIMTEITIINSEIKSVSVIDEMSSHTHEKYYLVKDSVIKALSKCKKLNLVSKFKTGEHLIRFKFVC